MSKTDDTATIDRIITVIHDSGVGPRHGARLLAKAIIRVLCEAPQSSAEPISVEEIEEMIRGA